MAFRSESYSYLEEISECLLHHTPDVTAFHIHKSKRDTKLRLSVHTFHQFYGQ